jgi:hypothetical protein
MKYFITLPALCFILVTLCLFKVADVEARPHPVIATVAGIEINTTVDSDFAREVLGDSVAPPSVAATSGLLDRLACNSDNDLPTTAELQSITEEFSTDTATALLAQCLYAVPKIRRSQQLFLSELAQYQNGDPAQQAYLKKRKEDYVILLVPGWGYLSHGEVTGANLRIPRTIISDLGFENHLVAIDEGGSVESTAATLVSAVKKHLATDKKIILVSASSGGPAVALALNNPEIASQPLLLGWLNICGVLNGTPVIDALMPWPKSLLLHVAALFEGWRYEDMLSLSQKRSRARYSRFVAPAQLTIVNYIGIPFSGQLNDKGMGFYSLLAAQGPNDGLTLITEALAPGHTIMAIGSDHFINEDPQINSKTAALVPVLLKLIEGHSDQDSGSSTKVTSSM